MEDIKIIHMAACKNCRKPLKDEWRFCPHCKSKIETVQCCHCKKEIKNHWRFCPFCRMEVKKGNKHRLVFEHGNKWIKNLLQYEE